MIAYLRAQTSVQFEGLHFLHHIARKNEKKHFTHMVFLRSSVLPVPARKRVISFAIVNRKLL